MKNTQYIKDGYLVVGAISQTGCVSYTHKDRKQEIDGERLDADWNTHKIVISVKEQRALGYTRNLLTKKISNLGTAISNFGVFVSKDLGNELEAAISVAREGVWEYNAKAKYTRLAFNFTVFEISGGDERVARALYDNTVSLLENVNECVEKGDVKGLRYALSRMKGISDILPKDTGAKLADQIKAAREAAKAAVKAADEGGSEDQKNKKIVDALKGVNATGLRASLIETIDEIDKCAKDTTFVPNADLVKARQIEAEIKAEMAEPKKAKKREVEAKPKKASSKKKAAAKREIE